jgi:glycosidase
VAVETKDPRSLLSHYRNWIGARKRSIALMKGDINPIDTGTQILAFIRDSGNERVLVVHNVSDSFVHAGPLAVSGASFETVFADRGVSDLAHTPEGWQVSLPPRSSGAWRLK